LQTLRTLLNLGFKDTGAIEGHQDEVLVGKVKAAVKQIEKGDNKDDIRRKLLSVSILLHNVLQYPENEECRQVKKDRIALQKDIFEGEDNPCLDILRLAGFEPANGGLIFSKEQNCTDTAMIRDLLQTALRQCARP